jgi:hypothetical protein
MMRTSRYAPVFATAAVLMAGSPTFAQSRSWEGCIFPMQFGAQGERHYYTYGYYGPLAPPLARERDNSSMRSKLTPRVSAIERIANQAVQHSRAAVAAGTEK